jgi:CRISPR-associated protein (TIGR03986 family)
MKNGIIVRKQIKKGFQYLIQYDENKSLVLNTKLLIPNTDIDDLLNQNVQFDNSGGQLNKIWLLSTNKLVYEFKKQEIKTPTSSTENQIINPKINYAHAPYNFIPINEKVVCSPLKIDEVLFNSYKDDCYTGEIFMEIESLTPLYIRGMKSISTDSLEKNPEFFKGKDYCIPGSSLRGLLRTITEIVSYSKMGSLNNDTKTRRFHYRAFADQSLTLRDEYASKMINRGNNPECFYPKVNAGIIKKEGLNYFICKGKHYKVEEELAINKGVISELMSMPNGDKFQKNRNYKPNFKKIFFKADIERIHSHSKNLKYAKVTDISNNQINSFKEGYLVCSGWMIGPGQGPRSRGKHMHWVIGDFQGSNKIKIEDDIVENYINDKARDGMNLLEKLKASPVNEVPCFFITDINNKIKSFGHTGMFRLAYDKTLIEFFPLDHRKINELDFTEILFGKLDKVPSRVCFEDAFIKEGSFSKDIKIPAIMGSPKPTTFQHYLKQDVNSITTELNNRYEISGYRGIKDYNQNTVINGYKLYWHQKSIDYPAIIELNTDAFKEFLTKNKLMNRFNNYHFQQNKTKIDLSLLTTEQSDALLKFILSQKESQYTAIKPILSNAKFEGKIRFENLTKIELGALLFILNPTNNLCYKIGMGKGLGFGSILITPKVIISDRKQRYSNILSEWIGFDSSNSELSKTETDDCIKVFEKHILSEIGSSSSSIWQEQRMIELKTMLDFNNCIKGDKAKFMLIDKKVIDENGKSKKINEYKSRPLLPKPTDYITNA